MHPDLRFFLIRPFPAVSEAGAAGASAPGSPQVVTCLHFVCLQLQRAVAVKRAIQDVLDRSPRLQALTPPKTREVVQWCRQRGYTPPDLEPQHKNDDESIEDILTQIDNEPGESCAQTAGFTDAAWRFSATQSGSIFSLHVWVKDYSS